MHPALPLLIFCAVACLPAGAAPLPNVLLILADDLGYGDLSCYNPEAKVTTPRLDALAAQGLRFTDAHSPSTVCTPSRYSILTGRLAVRLSYRGVFSGAGGPCLIEADRLTLPGMLREKGYETALFGKWHVGLTFHDHDGKPIHKGDLASARRIDYSRAIPDSPIHRGFDHFYGTACCPATDWIYAFIDGDRIPVPPTRQIDRSTLPHHEWSHDCREGMIAPDFDLEEVDGVFLDKSLRFLDTHAKESPDKPFFLFHSCQAVHLPSFPGKAYQGKSKAGPHGDFILQFDDIVGRLLDKVDTLGLAENTLVMVTSDNGPEVDTVLAMREKFQHDGARPWRGLKRDNWEAGHRVPFIVRWPGQTAPGTSDQTVCLSDIMATCAAIAGRSLPADTAEDSANLLPVLRGQATRPIRDFTLHQTWTLDLGIRQGAWKYLDHRGSGGNNYDKNPKLRALLPADEAPEAPGQLYDLARDPGELHNLYFRHPAVVKELRAKLDAVKAGARSVPAG